METLEHLARNIFHAIFMSWQRRKDMANTMEIHIGQRIKAELKRQGRTVTWLASQLHLSRQHMYYLLSHSYIYSDLLLRISDTMDFDFFSLYSEFLKSKKPS